jgi:hypothetical protein
VLLASLLALLLALLLADLWRSFGEREAHLWRM